METTASTTSNPRDFKSPSNLPLRDKKAMIIDVLMGLDDRFFDYVELKSSTTPAINIKDSFEGKIIQGYQLIISSTPINYTQFR